MHALSLGDHKRASAWVDVQSHSDGQKMFHITSRRISAMVLQ